MAMFLKTIACLSCPISASSLLLSFIPVIYHEVSYFALLRAPTMTLDLKAMDPQPRAKNLEPKPKQTNKKPFLLLRGSFFPRYFVTVTEAD